MVLGITCGCDGHSAFIIICLHRHTYLVDIDNSRLLGSGIPCITIRSHIFKHYIDILNVSLLSLTRVTRKRVASTPTKRQGKDVKSLAISARNASFDELHT